MTAYPTDLKCASCGHKLVIMSRTNHWQLTTHEYLYCDGCGKSIDADNGDQSIMLGRLLNGIKTKWED